MKTRTTPSRPGKSGRRFGRWIVPGYILVIHLLLVFALMRTDLLDQLKLRMGSLPAEPNKFYDEMLSYHQGVDAQVPAGSVLFFGDSIVQRLCVTCVNGQAVNFGIGGDTTLGVKTRLPRYQSVKQARSVVLSVGTNDLIRRPNSEILENIDNILNGVPGKVRIVLAAIFPVDTDSLTVRHRSNDRISALNGHLARLCGQTDNCDYLEINHLLTDDSGNLADKFHTGDGLHLNQHAYRLWINQLRKVL